MFEPSKKPLRRRLSIATGFPDRTGSSGLAGGTLTAHARVVGSKKIHHDTAAAVAETMYGFRLPTTAAGPLCHCMRKSVRWFEGPDADRRDKPLIVLRLAGSQDRAYSQGALGEIGRSRIPIALIRMSDDFRFNKVNNKAYFVPTLLPKQEDKFIGKKNKQSEDLRLYKVPDSGYIYTNENQPHSGG